MMMMEFSIFPVGTGESLSAAVVRAFHLVRKSGLPFRLTDMGTIVEGSPKECLRLVQKCIHLLSRDYARLSCSIKIDYRKGSRSRLGKKARKVIMLAQRAGKTPR